MITADIVLTAAVAGLSVNVAFGVYLLHLIAQYHRKLSVLEAEHAALKEAFGDQVAERDEEPAND